VVERVLQRALAVALVYRSSLGFVGVEERGRGAVGEYRGDLPAQFCASWIALVKPSPPVGGWRCAASPTRNAPPRQNDEASTASPTSV
jgi:hypothetical protein